MGTRHSETVRSEWVDYNGHMNVAYYVLVFDHGTDALLDAVGMGEAYRNAADRSVFVVESHVTYQAETHEGQTVTVETRVLEVVEKKVRVFHRMYADDPNVTVATNEILFLHVDLDTRRVIPMPAEAVAELRALRDADATLPMPAEAGRGVAMTRR